MNETNENRTQEERVLRALQDANGAWVNGQYFLRTMYLSQYHRAIWNLQHKRERYGYDGEVQASDFTDEHGFKSYRLVRGPAPVAAPPRSVSILSEAGRRRAEDKQDKML